MIEKLLNPEEKDVVASLNGRDKGKRFVVIGREEEYVLLADGKGRKVDKPKRKKFKHVSPDGRVTIAKLTNGEIRRALAEYAATCGEKGGM